MGELEYSTNALSVKGLFYNKDITIYVEGKDDLLFWKYIFNLAGTDAYIEDVGGLKEIEKYINKILLEDADFIVACDSDHSDFHKERADHKNIIRTYGYSIENSLYEPKEIEKIVQKLARVDKIFLDDVKGWINSFSEQMKDLLIYDVANARFNKNTSIFPKSCALFLKPKNSCEIDINKLNEYIEEIRKRSEFKIEELDEVRVKIEQSPKDLWFHLRGHFLTIGVIYLIKSLVKKTTGVNPVFSADVLYSFTVDCRNDWTNKIDIFTLVETIKENYA